MGNEISNKKNEKVSNSAIMEYSNGERYVGEVDNGLRDGYGTYYYQNGEKYEGQWLKNLKNGRGTFFFKNGEVYEGFWNSNKKEGVGTYNYINGERYYGEWKDNKKHGKGIMHYQDGSRFIGQFCHNKKDGIGELVRKDGVVYYEEWTKGILEKTCEKYKASLIKNDMIDYNQFNSGTFEKYLETKSKQQMDLKSNQIKSKYFTLEYAKMLKSKNPEGFYDTVRLMHNTNNLILEKPDITTWNVEEVVNFFVKLNFPLYEKNLRDSKIDGNMLANSNIEELLTLMGIDNKDRNTVGKTIISLRNLFNQRENLISIKSSKRISDFNSNELKSKILRENIYNKHEKNINIDLITEENNKTDENISFTDKLNEDEKSIQKDEQEQKENKDNIINNFTNAEILKELNSPSRNFSNTVNMNGLNFFIKFDEIKLSNKVGEGGFGEVFLGVWNGKKIALKKITVKENKFQKDYINKFINEINIISSLRHPNIVLYMGASIDKKNYYMITEYLPKGSLFDYIHRDRGKINEREQINIAYEIAVALKYLHSRNVVHCDLKSSNILIDDNWKIKIGDFGLSRFFSLEDTEESKGRIGTPHWMAPEVLKGEKYEHSADIFSFGMILWEILSLEIPYYGIDPYQVISLVAEQKRIVKVPEKGNVVIRKLIEHCLNYEKSKRPQCDEIVDILGKAKNHNKLYDSNLEELYDYLN